MMRRFVLVIFCLLIQSAGLCYGQGKTIYIYIVPPISATQTLQVYAKEDTTVIWQVLKGGPSLEIKFDADPPCQAYTNPLPVSDGKPAKCKITLPKGYKKDTVLHYSYQIIINHSKGPNPIFYQHVGSCDPCSDPGQVVGPVAPGSNPAATTTSKPTKSTTSRLTDWPLPHTETISCEPKPPQVDPDPLAVNIGDTIFWKNPQNADTPQWTIKFDDEAVCGKDAPTFDVPRCKVAAVKNGTYSYTVVVGDPLSPTCTIHANVTVPAAAPK